jgi:hypothetical protein
MEQPGNSPYYPLLMNASAEPSYLSPYLKASRKFGSGFGTLLWASPKTQAVRFKALLSAVEIDGRSIMDVGCGRADFLEFMLKSGRCPGSYVGVEAVEALAHAAERKNLPRCKIVIGDFVQDPRLLDTRSDILFYSGSLNTMETDDFYRCIAQAYAAAQHAVVFNFLCSAFLAGSSHLSWHPPDEVMAFSRTLSPRATLMDRYMRGDATVIIFKDES